ncbi:hypothetical protein HQQ94_13430 [Shewanella sp. VB17]|uniref:hypothetical protein n=1 Tax=Shewanella sp. VB17 TaxID=2739432 RepID=UPI001567BEFB|nr:hypothetical protein [Shewanella sp. VB17]NRD74219.1 hypothetical protein [Shewanella sp. VB17]
MRKLIQFIWPNFTRSSCSRVPSAEIQETSNNNDVIIPLYRRSLATISPSRSHITLSGICGLSLALLFTQTAHAEDLYAPDDWIINQDTHINAGDRMIVNADAQVTLAAGITLAIDSGAELIIKDGVNVNVDSGAKIEVYGSLLSQGLAGNETRFTSSLASPTHSSWQGIYANSGAKVNLSYTQISHAVTGIYANLTVINDDASDNDTQINVEHSRFINNSYGAFFYQLNNQIPLTANLQYNQFIGTQNHHLYAMGGSPMMATQIDARYNWWDSALAVTVASKIFDSRQSPLGLNVDYSDNYFSASMQSTQERSLAISLPTELLIDGEYGLFNDYYAVANLNISSGQILTLKAGNTLTIKAGVKLNLASGAQLIIEEGAKVELEDSANITVAAGATWQLNAGTQVLSALNVQLNIYGRLYAVGTQDNRVYFGSSFETPEKGRWFGIKAMSKSRIYLSYTQIKHANYGLWFYLNTYSTTSTSQAVLNVNHSYFNENVNGIRLEDAYGANYISASIQYNDFVDNDIHLYTQDKVTGGASVDARYNWWNTTDFTDIAAKIVDKKASTTGMLVDYSQYRLSNDIADIPQNLIYYHFPDALYEETKGYRLENNSIIEGNTSTKASQEIVLQAGHQLTIKAGKTLTIVAGSSFIIEDGAKLIVEDGAVINSAGTWSVADNAELSFGASSKIKVSAGSWAVAENAKLNFGHSANVTIAAGATWQLNAGTQVLSALNVQLNIVGTLKAQGTEDNLVYFGSSFETPEKGRWIGIVAFGKPNINLSYTQIKHANYGLWLYLNTNSTTSTSQAVLNVNHSYFNENVNGIRLEDAYGHNYISASIQYNDFVDNDIHLYTQDKVTGGASVDARYNWWSTTEFADIAAKIVDKRPAQQACQLTIVNIAYPMILLIFRRI